MSSFATGLAMTIIKSVRDYNNDKAKQKEKHSEYCQKLYEEIAESSDFICEFVREIIITANLSYIPDYIYEGAEVLLFNAFLNVFKVQKVNPTQEQDILIDVFFKHYEPKFAKTDFYSCIRNNNQTFKYINELVYISDDGIGTFWPLFFQAAYKVNKERIVLSKFIDKYTMMIKNIALLNSSNLEVAPICETFNNSIKKQILNYQELPCGEIDFFGVMPYSKHFMAMKNISNELIHAADLEETIETDVFFKFFCIGIIYEVVLRTDHNISEMGDMLNTVINTCGIDIDVTGYELVKQLLDDTKISEIVNKLIGMQPDLTSFWCVVLYAGQETNRMDEATSFTKECYSFLIGLENDLKRIYNFTVTESLATNYMSGIFNSIGSLFD
jgi:hypothetical protein